MCRYEENEEEPFFPSPLKLLYTAYSDQCPVVSRAMEEGFQKMDGLLSPLPEQDRKQVLRTFYEIYQENESQAFQSGIRTGVRLAKDLMGR